MVLPLIIDNWEAITGGIAVATATVAGVVRGVSLKKKKTRNQNNEEPFQEPPVILPSPPKIPELKSPIVQPVSEHDKVNSTLPEEWRFTRSYESFSRCVATNTHSYLSTIYQIYKKEFVGELRKSGMSDEDLQKSKRLTDFHNAISVAIHRRMMPAVLEAIYDNDIPDTDTALNDAILTGNISELARLDKTTKWYHDHIIHFIDEVFSSLTDNWRDSQISSDDFRKIIDKREMNTIIKHTVDMFTKIRIKREKIVAMGVKGTNASPDAVIAQWNSSFMLTGITSLMRG